ncbi:MAG TPA: biotin-dependent carboxyltransferase family protein [Candidimonas sp.]|nr:biotin-dependent carboxyltransferase family protein [Candidimonas sp.]
MSITVLKPGLLSSFQDLGRFGHQHLGVAVSGAMDGRAHRLANILVGNSEEAATLEITLVGPALRFDAPACIAISGANLSPTLNARPVPNNRPLVVRTGDVLAFGARKSGLRAYIAWHGGIDLPVVLSSRSTYLRGGFGGFHGRALKKDDVFSMHASLQPYSPQALDELEAELWKIQVYLPAILGLVPRAAIRVMRGEHTPMFTDTSIAHFLSAEFRVRPESERMGYRLQGPTLALRSRADLLSEPTCFGAVQVPPDGNPIILMADRQTTGGYAKIAHVATVDLPVIAQCMPGEALRFTEITLAQGQQLDGRREEAFGRLRQTLTSLRSLF